MTFDTNWDVEKYKYHYELDHQWKLKKKFIVAHKNKYPENRLVCLAQIYCNVHFLGCRYDEPVMELIDELSEGLSEKNEKWQKPSFVAASSAVEERVKDRLSLGEQHDSHLKQFINRCYTLYGSTVRSNATSPNSNSQDEMKWNLVNLNDIQKMETGPSASFPKRMVTSNIQQNDILEKHKGLMDGGETKPFTSTFHNASEVDRLSGPHRPAQTSKFVQFVQSTTNLCSIKGEDDIVTDEAKRGQKRKSEEQHIDEPQDKSKKIFDNQKANLDIQFVTESGPFGRVVLFESSLREENPINIIERTATAAHMITNFQFTAQANQEYSCKLMLDGLYLATGSGRTQKLSKESACKVAVARLKETSFTILVKAPYSGTDQIDRSLNLNASDSSRASLDMPISNDNIGSKMLKLMGWAGGGLGKNEQGIEEPLRPNESSIKRGGLGIKNFYDFKQKITAMIEEFAHSDRKDDLVFSPDFTKDERKAIHELVRKYNLKSKSYGKNEDERHIVIFKKIKPLEIVEDLLISGGETDKYKLIPPKSMKNRFE